MTRQEQLNNEMFTVLKEESNNRPFLNTEIGQYMYQLGFEKGAEIDRKIMIDKVCEYLKNINTDNYMDSGIFQIYDLIKDFRKAMEE